MRLEVSYLAAAANLAVFCSAQNIPACASTCASEAAAGLFGCVSSDLACSCNPPSSNQYLACIQEVCPPQAVAEFKTWAEAECAKYITNSGATPTTSSGSASSQNSASAVAVQPSSAGSSSGSGSGSGSGPSSGGGTSAGTVATVTATVTHSGAGVGSGEQKTGLAALLAVIAALV